MDSSTSEMKSKSRKRTKKRRFRGNQHSAKVNASETCRSSSAKKLGLENKEYAGTVVDPTFQGYRLIDIQLVLSEINKCVRCHKCGDSIKIEEDLVIGLASVYSITCIKCGQLASFRNCRMVGEKFNVPEINRRSIYAMRCIGKGHSEFNTFCGVMDLPPPVSTPTYNINNQLINLATKEVSEQSMRKAAEEERALTVQDTNISVSGDGTWKTRGHTSLTGVCTIIGAEGGKVIDAEVMSSYCKGCEEWKGEYRGKEFDKWSEQHKVSCVKNHSGSAGKMEVDGMVRIFQRSKDTRNACYTEYIGDGDTKTFSAISSSQPYGPDVSIQKVECVGHVQKRMGTRLRKLKHDMRGKKLSDGKSISGKGRLTDRDIDLLTTYYGNAIREHNDSVLEMRKAVWAIFYHKRSTDVEPTHTFCPKGSDSWCKYQKLVCVGKKSTFRHHNSLPVAVMDAMKPIFKDLSSPDLLKRCLGGRTQNTNESINSLIWKFCPKTSGSGRRIVEIATGEAVIIFNEGCQGRLRTMQSLGLTPGKYALQAAVRTDEKRIETAEKRTACATLEVRRKKRRIRQSAAEAALRKEGCMYAAGRF